jgi:sigma-B regulation protein RsbU (phosphoserine phosphatase)
MAGYSAIYQDDFPGNTANIGPMPAPQPIRRLPVHRLMVCALTCLAVFGSVLAPEAAGQLGANPANAASKNGEASFNYEASREPVVSLDGLWHFHPGDDAKWSDPAFDDSNWPLLRSDQPWSDQGYPGMSGFGWYRFNILVPAMHPALALDLGPIVTSWQAFVDGKLVTSVGHMPPNIFPTVNSNYHLVPLIGPGAGSEHSASRRILVAIRVWHSPIWSSYIGGGPSYGPQIAGDSNLVAAEQRHHDEHRRLIFVDYFSYAIVASIVGITIIGLFLFRPQEREYLWFAIVLMAKSVDAALTVIYQVYAVPPVPIYDIFDGSLIACAQIALMLFLTRVLKLRRGFFWNVIFILALASPIFNVLYWPGWMSAAAGGLIQVFCLLPSSVWMLAILSAGAYRRNPNARLLLLPVALVQGLWLADNIVIALNQFGLPVEARIIETPVVVAPFTMHPALLAELLFLLAMLAFLIRRFTIARRREERWEGALEAARQVQNLLLPEAIPQVEGFKVDCIYRPADMVGGDFFQILPTDDGNLLIVVGDVAGKGLPAAMMVSMIVGTIRSEAAHANDPAQLASALNDRMMARSLSKPGNDPASGFTTCLCAHLSTSGRLVMANAGHIPPYRNGEELPMPGALPLGMLGGVAYDLVTVQLAPGDRLTFVSDGVVEAQSKSGELLGFERTQQLSTKSAAEIAEIANRFGQVDDITVVTIEFIGNPVTLSATLNPETVLR